MILLCEHDRRLIGRFARQHGTICGKDSFSSPCIIVRVVAVSGTSEGQSQLHLSYQLLKAGTSVGANYDRG